MKRLIVGIYLCLTSYPIIGTLTPADATKIGMLIWQNEASQRLDLLTFWNPNENFPSLGIGHFIWQPAGTTIPYTQQFPAMCRYLQAHDVQLPTWLAQALPTGAPWSSRAEFLADESRLQELQQLFVKTIDLQTNFMIKQFDQQCTTVIAAVPADQKAQVERNVQLLRSLPQGIYALVDYCNFKGPGLNPNETKDTEGWGLKHVLLDMPADLDVDNVRAAFTVSAAQILLRRIRNSAPQYTTTRYLHGWMKRVSGYRDPEIFNTVLDSATATLDPEKITTRVALFAELDQALTMAQLQLTINNSDHKTATRTITYLNCVKAKAQMGALSAGMLRQCAQQAGGNLPLSCTSLADKIAIASCAITNQELAELRQQK